LSRSPGKNRAGGGINPPKNAYKTSASPATRSVLTIRGTLKWGNAPEHLQPQAVGGQQPTREADEIAGECVRIVVPGLKIWHDGQEDEEDAEDPEEQKGRRYTVQPASPAESPEQGNTEFEQACEGDAQQHGAGSP